MFDHLANCDVILTEEAEDVFVDVKDEIMGLMRRYGMTAEDEYSKLIMYVKPMIYYMDPQGEIERLRRLVNDFKNYVDSLNADLKSLICNTFVKKMAKTVTLYYRFGDISRKDKVDILTLLKSLT
jgi:hypothetical protein